MINAYKVPVGKHMVNGSRWECKSKVEIDGYGGRRGLEPFDSGHCQVANVVNTVMYRAVRYDAGHLLTM
jgi:hypothetical protein